MRMDDSSSIAVLLDDPASQSHEVGPKRLQTRPTSNLQTNSLSCPKRPASTTPSPPGQCSSNVQPPPSPGARLPALLPSPSAPSLPPSFAVRNSSNGLIRPSHNCSNPRAPRPQGAVYRQLQLTWSTYCDYQLTPNSYSQREEVGSQAGGQDSDFRWLVLYPIPQQSIAFLPASAARNLLF